MNTSLGPYRILASLGAGGMGEVYRARDTRLARDVAIKVIRAEVARDPERIKRFEQEARAAGALSHPNVCTIYDVGTHDGVPYVVMELLEGESLRARLGAGPLPARKAIDYAAQVAHGLAAAHEKGIVHRDLKPENLFVTKDGRVKVLDFGLAKLTRPEVLAPSGEPTISIAATETGVILGTVGYMAPEQVLGTAADARSDLFALGAILYELLTAKRAFHGASYVETLHSILSDEPAPLSENGREIPLALESIVRRCLEKSPAERFQSASDLAFALEASAGILQTGRVTVRQAPRWRRWVVPAAIVALAAVAAAGTYLAGRNSGKHASAPLERVSFRRGQVGYARFTPDGQSVAYFASFVGDRAQLYTQRLTSPDARPLGVQAQVVGMFGGEMATLDLAPGRRGTLARMPIEGGTPRDLVDSVSRADWSRDGKRLLVVRRVSPDSSNLECPPGTVILGQGGRQQMDTPRFSPRGDRIAFVRYLIPDVGTGGEIVVTDLHGRQKVLSPGWSDVDGLAWSPDGREVWFTATKTSKPPAVWAVTLGGKERLLAALPGAMKIRDVAPDGRVLFTHATRRYEQRGRTAVDSVERDLSWLDATATGYLSPDGMQMVFQEAGEGTRSRSGATYYRRMDGSMPVRLADCCPLGVSPDWKWVLATGPGAKDSSDAGRLLLVPIGAGQVRELPRGSIQRYGWAWFFPTGDSLIIWGNEARGPLRLFVQRLDGGLPRPILHEGVSGSQLSGDGRFVALRPPGKMAPFMFYPISGGKPRPIPGIRVGETPIQATPDGRSLFVQVGQDTRREIVTRIDLQTGARQPWLNVAPPDSVGADGVIVVLNENGRYYTYCYQRLLSDLYVMPRPR